MATKEEILSAFTSKEAAWFAYKEGVQTGYYEAYNSLRNQAAIAAMQGLLANPSRTGCFKDCAEAAIECADALIKQLKNKQL